ncbi:E3 SUMO-protein ligase ZBED1-like [Paramisgurnus dabryanus]|uniref:E3 SUMO-protein ligase ZBED1-like n=1 Tax=Paramisgurnus dabryanus TaxID=90735 RepID=UPI003CCF2612
MKRAKKSSVWDHFTKKNDTDVSCNLCDTMLKYSSSTSSMMYHLKTRHPQASSGEKASQSQPTVSSMLAGRKCDKQRSEIITQKICGMIEKDMLPLDFVSGEGFLEILQFLEPNYTVPSRQTITTRIEERFVKKKFELKARLYGARCVAITTDCWTALTTESYVTVTCHWIDKVWQVKSAVLLTKSMPGRHTADNLAATLNEAVDAWGMTGKVVACVHDNASNIVAANIPERVDWVSVACFAHTLQLAINDAFKLFVYKVISAAGKLVCHFNHSTVACKALQEKQEQMQLPKHKLVQSCKTRWNSVFDMFERLLEQRWAVTAVLSDRNVTKLQDARILEIKDEYWAIMADLKPVLETLKCATTIMSSEKTVSISHIYPITFSIINKHMAIATDDRPRVAEFKATVRQSLSERMEVDYYERLVAMPAMIASALDPRHKHLPFLSREKQKAVLDKLKELCADVEHAIEEDMGDEEEPGAAGGDDDVAVTAGPSSGASHKESAMSLLLGDDYSAADATDPQLEVDTYVKDSRPSLESNPLDWWRANQTRFPRLAILAQRYLCIPGTSVPSERVFSAAGLVVNRLRTRLTPEHVDMLVFLNKNK